MKAGSYKTLISFSAALGGVFALAACGMSGQGLRDGVPLSQLDMEGAAPTQLSVAVPDTIRVAEGNRLAIDVSGSEDAREGLLFRLEGESLSIGREADWNGPSKATISITMPPLKEINLAGSGKLSAANMTGDAEINVAGSGDIAIADVSATSLKVNIMGSGDVRAVGQAERLDFNIAGSGSLNAPELKVGDAQVKIAGSGGGIFSSEGHVEGRIAGSGNVTVLGNARCSVKSVGSGKVRCRQPE